MQSSTQLFSAEKSYNSATHVPTTRKKVKNAKPGPEELEKWFYLGRQEIPGRPTLFVDLDNTLALAMPQKLKPSTSYSDFAHKAFFSIQLRDEKGENKGKGFGR